MGWVQDERNGDAGSGLGLSGKGVISYNQGQPGPGPAIKPANAGSQKSALPFRRKILYYGLLLLLVLLASEGMARIAYYAAYSQWYGGGRAAAPVNAALPPDFTRYYQIRHPFYGFTRSAPEQELNAMPPRQRQEDTVIIGLLGGSVAGAIAPFLQSALNRRFAANNLPQKPVVLNLAVSGAKQPQQAMIVANNLLLGGEFDLLVNLDGINEVVNSAGLNVNDAVFPFLPLWWDKRVGLTGAEILLAGRIGILRQEQARLAAVGESSPLRRSALFGLVNRWRQESAAAEIILLNRQLAAAAADYSLEKYGPRNWPQEAELFPAAARVWYRGSLALARLSELAGADYYHFLQPNPYVPNAKPLSPEEQEMAYKPAGNYGAAALKGYPLLRRYNRALQDAGINYFDLTGVFADRPETLYVDDCCHLNDRGYELLAAAVARHLEPALRRRDGSRPAAPVAALTAAQRPAAKAPPPAFQVSLAADGKALRYTRENCAAADVEPDFFLHLIPRDLADLPPNRREQGFDNRNFSFAAAGGRRAAGQCAAQIPLPDYPIATLRTGQYVLGLGERWSTELIIPADPHQLRETYAALAAAEPLVRDYFDLYRRDNRLIYLRESCAAGDTAANFFLHIIPQDVTDLPAERRAAGFAHAGFAFARHGGPFDGKCLAAVALPDYPVNALRTGQHIPGQGDLWAVALTLPADLAELRADYAALSAANLVVRDYFDLYELDNRLLYLRESCAAADTAADFFLHFIPQEITALPADRQEAGFAHAGFAFAQQGGRFDGKCLAAVPLPDYPLAGLRTGQYIPDQGELWSVRLFAAP